MICWSLNFLDVIMDSCGRCVSGAAISLPILKPLPFCRKMKGLSLKMREWTLPESMDVFSWNAAPKLGSMWNSVLRSLF